MNDGRTPHPRDWFISVTNSDGSPLSDYDALAEWLWKKTGGLVDMASKPKVRARCTGCWVQVGHGIPHELGNCSVISSFNKTCGNVHLPAIAFTKQEICSLVEKEPPSVEALLKALTKEVKEVKSSVTGLDKCTSLLEQKAGLKCAASGDQSTKKKPKTEGASGAQEKSCGARGAGKKTARGAGRCKGGPSRST
jgi:hypothetical protein